MSEALRLADLLEERSKLFKEERHQAAAELRRLHAENEALKADLERERMRLAACGVVALADTPDSAQRARQMYPGYESASCDDVARRVDECMKLRALNAELVEALRSMLYDDDQDEATNKARAALAKVGVSK